MTAHFDPEQITFFAKTDARGQEVPFGIKAKDRQRHMYVIGKTGMGKSTLLENMAAQDIMNGEGMAFIDPHGSAAETLLEYVPEHRVDDVVYFAPFDLEHPVSFNVMEDVGPDKRHLVVSGLMSTFKKIWVDAWSARMEYILTNALLALIEYPDTTLLSVNRLFVDKEYRNRVVDYVKDPAVKSFWTDEFANYTDRFAAEALPAIQNKIGQFTGNPLIRNIIGQPHSSFDIRQIIDERKILIMNLSKGLIGETNANLLGSMLTTRIYLAAMSRADLPMETMRQMPNFYFFVDEFQSFANATFADILSEARKYHLNLIIAHQYIEQMEEDVRNAVFGNVGTTVAFRVGPFDAEVLETIFAPRFAAADLVNLGFAQIYLTLMIDGIGSQPFSATTLPPITRPHLSCRDMVIAASRRHYAKDRQTVEQVVSDLHAPQLDQKPSKNTGSGGADKKRSPLAGSAASGNGGTTPTPTPQKDAPERRESNAPSPAARAASGGAAPRESSPREATPGASSGVGSRERGVRDADTPRRERPADDRPRGNRANEPRREEGNRSSSQKTAREQRPPSAKQGAGREQSLDELRSVLAQLSKPEGKASGEQTRSGTDDSSPAPSPSPEPRADAAPSAPPSRTERPPTPAPATPPAAREKPAPTSNRVPEGEKGSDLRSALAAAINRSPSAASQPADQQPSSPPAPREDPPHETKQRVPTERAAADPLDPKQIKRMLQQSRSERNPFT